MWCLTACVAHVGRRSEARCGPRPSCIDNNFLPPPDNNFLPPPSSSTRVSSSTRKRTRNTRRRKRRSERRRRKANGRKGTKRERREARRARNASDSQHPRPANPSDRQHPRRDRQPPRSKPRVLPVQPRPRMSPSKRRALTRAAWQWSNLHTALCSNLTQHFGATCTQHFFLPQNLYQNTPNFMSTEKG